MNRLQKLVARWEKKNAKITKAVSSDIIAQLGGSPDISKVTKVVDAVLKKHGVAIDSRDMLLDYIAEGVQIAVGDESAPVKKVSSFKKWYLEKARGADGSKFSATANNLSRRAEMVADIKAGLKANQSWTEMARTLHKKGYQRGEVAKDVQRLAQRARAAYGQTADSQAMAEYLRDLRRVQARVDQLKDAPVGKLKAAYQDILDLTEKASEKQVQAALENATYWKQRYHAERIARTEIAKAYGEAVVSSAIQNEDIVGVQFILSDAHDVPDICDVHTGADLYGMGKGVYPKNHMPDFPFHANCLLPGNRVYFKGQVGAACKSFYCGEVVKITTSTGKTCTITRNHPVLTARGWVHADKLVKSDKVVVSKFGKSEIFAPNPNDHKMHPRVEDVFTALHKTSGMVSGRVPTSPKDFHGDGVFIQENINVVLPKGILRYTFNAIRFKIFKDKFFGIRNINRLNLSRFCAFDALFKWAFFAADGIVCSLRNSAASLRCMIEGAKSSLGFTNTTYADQVFYEPALDNVATNPIHVRNGLTRLSHNIAFDNVSDITFCQYSGHVYDLQVDENEIYISNGILVKNCTCSAVHIEEGAAPSNTAEDFRPKAMERFLAGQPESVQKQLLGANGSPKTWRDDLRQWNGHKDQKVTIPEKYL
jgi:hypothetical protein